MKNLVQTKTFVERSTSELAASVHYTEIEELSLNFTVPGYPSYVLHSEKNYEMVRVVFKFESLVGIVDASNNIFFLRSLWII